MTKILKIPKKQVRRDDDVFLYHEPKARKVAGAFIPKRTSSRSLPTVMDITLGAKYINHCHILGMDHLAINIENYRHFVISKHVTLGDLYDEAEYQTMTYNEEYGTCFIIGDNVEAIRKSTDDMEAIYGEPTEDRPDRLSFHSDYDPGRYDGDARFTPMRDKDYEIIWDGGRWMHDGTEWIHQSPEDYFNNKTN